MTLIELMVAMVIGLFLTWGAIEVYVQGKNSYRAAEVLARLQENARFALDTMEPDLRLAGLWGRHRETALVDPPAGIGVSCGGADVTDWALDTNVPIAASDDGYDLDCAPHSEARADSDVLIVRHASDLQTPPQAGQIQVQSNLALARIFNNGVIPAGFGPDAETRDLVVHAYYVDNTSSFSDSIPSLRRQTLVNGGLIEDQEMITGVENLQVQFGLDTNGDGRVERYVDPDSPAVAGGAEIAAVRIWMLVRSEESPGQSFDDEREYRPLDLELDPITPGGELYPDNFQRLAITKTVFLRNQGPG
jgi:Tfp pilus assembly protein PilW